MTKKQKKMLYRIIITFILFSILMVTEHLGMLEKFNTIVLFIIYLIRYLVIGYGRQPEISKMDRYLMRTF